MKERLVPLIHKLADHLGELLLRTSPCAHKEMTKDSLVASACRLGTRQPMAFAGVNVVRGECKVLLFIKTHILCIAYKYYFQIT